MSNRKRKKASGPAPSAVLPPKKTPRPALPVPRTVEDSCGPASELVAPWSWCFTRFSTALATTLVLCPTLWLVLIVIRKHLFPGNPFYWNHEMTLTLAFTVAGVTSLFLARLLNQLIVDLSGYHPDMHGLLSGLRDRFHDWRWLVPGPLLLGAVAISIRYVTALEFTPFDTLAVDLLFSGWLLVGFFFMLNATVLCGRYTELVRRIAHEVAVGKLGRAETGLLSRFYLKVAVLATVHFGLCVIIIYTLHLVYTYRGLMWPAYALLRWRPGLGLAGQLTMLLKDPLFFELAIFFGLLALASLAPLLYFTYPQWEVHKLLDARRQALLAGVRSRLDEVERRLTPDAPEAEFDLFDRRRSAVRAIEEMPTWPFSGYGTLGTVLLIALP
ncbi:MAG TPA: hypothetical protein PLP29_09955, partial [Candidatus Ozemobacteraceae bacterium]|nr:hypothetical protein [Candidatus Ozemobacteraceae bacterium]